MTERASTLAANILSHILLAVSNLLRTRPRISCNVCTHCKNKRRPRFRYAPFNLIFEQTHKQHENQLTNLLFLLKTYHYIIMKELPEEIWTMIARNLKREPPPVGQQGNWNDHFHQQDLVNLMRVNLVSLNGHATLCRKKERERHC